MNLAILAEVGELTNEIKFGMFDSKTGELKHKPWCWWKRDEEKASWDELVLGELVDILHFLLTGLIDDGWLDNDKLHYTIQASIDASLVAAKRHEWMPGDFVEFLSGIANPSESFAARLWFWVVVLHYLGFTFRNVEDFYGKSVEKNLTRWGAEIDAPE